MKPCLMPIVLTIPAKRLAVMQGLSSAGDSGGRRRRSVTSFRLSPIPGIWEDTMAKGQIKGNKEAKKPKSSAPKGSVSEYKKSQGKSGQSLSPPGKK